MTSISINVATHNRSVGYGQAAYNIVKSLDEQGKDVHVNDPGAEVQVHFSQPEHWALINPKRYNIGYIPWESTLIPADWLQYTKKLNEFWTTSDWCADVFDKNGVDVDRIVPHGVDTNVWTRKTRKLEFGGTLEFLHHGAPDARKNAQMTYEAFREAFGNNPHYRLTIKSRGASQVKQTMTGPHDNVQLIFQDCTEEQLVGLYHRSHALIYPSAGEGFGFIPAQAIATGLPVATVRQWCHYNDYVPYGIQATQIPSPWEVHKGEIYWPNYVDLVDVYRSIANDAEKGYIFGAAYGLSEKFAEEYSWNAIVKKAFKGIL